MAVTTSIFPVMAATAANALVSTGWLMVQGERRWSRSRSLQAGRSRKRDKSARQPGGTTKLTGSFSSHKDNNC